MNDLIQRLQAIGRVLQQPLTNTAKVVQFIQHIHGINLTPLPRSVRQPIEDNAIFLNSILSQYDIVTFDDYNDIAPDDIRALVDNIQWLYQTLIMRPMVMKHL